MSLSRDSMCSYSSEIIYICLWLITLYESCLKIISPSGKCEWKREHSGLKSKFSAENCWLVFFFLLPNCTKHSIKSFEFRFSSEKHQFFSCFVSFPKESRCPPWTNFCYVKINFVLASGLTTTWVSLLQQLTNTPKHLISLTDTVIF